MKKAIVTGATGFLGRHLVKCLAGEGVQVYAVFRQANGGAVLPPNVVCLCNDLSEPHELARQLRAAGAENADVFYHTAWSGVAQKEKNNYAVQKENLLYSMSALDAASELACGKFINIGTVAEYVKNTALIQGDTVPTPNDVYGATKVAVHYLLEACAHNRKQPFIHVILSSTYGEYRKDGSIIPYTIEMLLQGGRPSFGALDQMWNFIYIKDAAYALYKVGELGRPGKTYPIGTEDRRPLYAYICELRDHIDSTLPLDVGEKTALYSNVRSSCVDIEELKRDTGFTPRYNFAEGIQNTITWLRGGVNPI